MGFTAKLNKIIADLILEDLALKAQARKASEPPYDQVNIDLMLWLRQWAGSYIINVPGNENWGTQSLTKLFNAREAALTESSPEGLRKIIEHGIGMLKTSEFAEMKQLQVCYFYLQQQTIDNYISFCVGLSRQKMNTINQEENKARWRELYMSPGDIYVDECARRLKKAFSKVRIVTEPVIAGMYLPFRPTSERYAALQKEAKAVPVKDEKEREKLMAEVFPDDLPSDSAFWNSRMICSKTGREIVAGIIDMMAENRKFMRDMKSEDAEMHDAAMRGDDISPKPEPEGADRPQLVLTYDKGFFKSPIKNAYKPRTRFPFRVEELEHEKEWLEAWYKVADPETPRDAPEFSRFLDHPIYNLQRILDTPWLAALLYQFVTRYVLEALESPSFLKQKRALQGCRLVIDGGNGYGVPNRQLPTIDRMKLKPVEPLVLDITRGNELVPRPEEAKRLANAICEGDHLGPFYFRKMLKEGGHGAIVSEDTDMLFYMSMYLCLYGDAHKHRVGLKTKKDLRDINTINQILEKRFGKLGIPSFWMWMMLDGTDPTPHSTPHMVTHQNFVDELKQNHKKLRPICDVKFIPVDSKTLTDVNANVRKARFKYPFITMLSGHFHEFCRVYVAAMQRKYPDLKEISSKGPWCYFLKTEQKKFKDDAPPHYLMLNHLKARIDSVVLQAIFRRLRYNMLLAFAFLEVHDLRTFGLQQHPDGGSIYGFAKDASATKTVCFGDSCIKQAEP